ncbi:MAG: polymer-forming cytoskeletal protein [Gemmatimonadetes bacterium]|nr:polymer-forming cytoskeletal protein [Gemmatimonadota bacterium]
MFRSSKGLLALSLFALAVPACARAQDRAVVSKEVAVGRSEATLRLEFAQGKPLEIAMRDGSVVIDGETVGTYDPAGGLDAAWRALLGGAVSLDDGALATLLRDWSPPADLKGNDGAMGHRIDEAIQDALTTKAAPEKPKPDISLSVGKGDQGALLQALLSQAGRLGLLEQALTGIDTNIQLHIDEDVDVAADQTVEGNLVVIQGDARVEGTVDGDVIVVGGTLELRDGGHITGDVRLADSRIERDGGTVDGEVRDVSGDESVVDSATRARIRDQVRDELRDELRNQVRDATRSRRSPASSFFAPLGGVFRGLGGLIQDMVTIFVLTLLAMGVLAFAGDNLDNVAEMARMAPGRSAMVGLAGTFLLIPIWLVGAVALAVSIVGIPVMIAWLPLFPLAAVAAALLGYLSVARNVGEWLADSDYRYTDWIRKSNPVYTIVGGLVGLGAFFIAGHVLSMVPFLGFVHGLLTFVGVMISIVALQIGFGAVILTRGGRRREAYAGAYDAEWESAADMDLGNDGPSEEPPVAPDEPQGDNDA